MILVADNILRFFWFPKGLKMVRWNLFFWILVPLTGEGGVAVAIGCDGASGFAPQSRRFEFVRGWRSHRQSLHVVGTRHPLRQRALDALAGRLQMSTEIAKVAHSVFSDSWPCGCSRHPPCQNSWQKSQWQIPVALANMICISCAGSVPLALLLMHGSGEMWQCAFRPADECALSGGNCAVTFSAGPRHAKSVPSSFDHWSVCPS